MSNLSSAINTALRALEANQLALSVASNNIANAQTPGYSRERVIMRPAANLEGTFPVGAGVEVLGTESVRDRVIELRLREEISQQSQSDFTHRALSDVEMLFNESESTGLLPQLTKFFNSFHALSTDPASTNLRQELIANATGLVNFFHARHGELRSMQSAVDRAIDQDVARINTLASEIATLTSRITEQEGLRAAHELRDQREILVKQLSEIVEVKELDSPGSYHLSIGGYRPLVLNGTAMPVTAERSLTTGFLEIHANGQDITSDLSGGRLNARVGVRDEYLPRYMQALDGMAYEIAGRVNDLHGAAYDLDGDTGLNFFAPLASATNAARDIQLSSDVTSSTRNIAASAQASGLDNQAAIAMGNLLHASVFSGGSVTDQYRSLIFAIGSDTAGAELATKQHDALVNQLQNRRQEVSGVSIDEEAVRILQFQRAYEASARVVRVMDELLQVTLSLGN